jgi:hypothetical protein
MKERNYMELIIKILLTKVIELGCKYAEKKFTEAKAGTDKKAYVLKKVDEALDINHDGIETIKGDIAGFVDEKIEETIAKFQKK